MVLTAGTVSPLVIPFATLFSGPLSPPIQEPSSPEITSTPIEEDIADPPIVPTVLNLGNGPRLVAYPLGTPGLEQVMVVALGLAHNGPSFSSSYSSVKQNNVATEPMRTQYFELGKTTVQ
ncbi:hypothetical protein DSO57_1019012 [Entomophthora muscae]|uniref:Uncharacterized protein n=1 Tax=Entomophthora muscae TaxID=34485 RepID=A0ACC2RVC7_9FUNG|nr:hypothetical protein DSO57_1019012 [Entomophthora muscae]